MLILSVRLGNSLTSTKQWRCGQSHRAYRSFPISKTASGPSWVARYLPFEHLAISPQCDFASSLHGNLLSEEDRFRKLGVMLKTARKVWEA